MTEKTLKGETRCKHVLIDGAGTYCEKVPTPGHDYHKYRRTDCLGEFCKFPEFYEQEGKQKALYPYIPKEKSRIKLYTPGSFRVDKEKNWLFKPKV